MLWFELVDGVVVEWEVGPQCVVSTAVLDLVANICQCSSQNSAGRLAGSLARIKTLQTLRSVVTGAVSIPVNHCCYMI